MRAVGLSDLDQAARAVMAKPQGEQIEFAHQLLEDAHWADKWRKVFRTAHPNGGTGSLYAQAMLHPRVVSSAHEPRYCVALEAVLQALATFRGRID